MTLLKKIIKEEHEAIKVHYSNGDADRPGTPAITLYDNSGRLTLRLNKMPDELIMQVKDEDAKSGRWALSDRLSARFHELKTKNPEAHEKLRDEFYEIFGDGAAKDLKTALEAEMAELFAHVTTLLKSRLVEYVHDRERAEEKYYAEQEKIFNAKLDALLK